MNRVDATVLAGARLRRISAAAIVLCLVAQLVVFNHPRAQAAEGLCAQGRGCEDWIAVHEWDVSGTGFARSLALDAVGESIYATGGYGPSFFDGNMETVAYAADDADDGVFGDEIDEQWIATHDTGPGAEQDRAWAVATSPKDGTVFMVGDVKSPDHNFTDWAVVSFGSNGARRWTSIYQAPPLQGEFHDVHSAKAVAVSPDGETIYVGGRTPQRSLSGDYTTIAYDADTGQQLWLAYYNGTLSAFDEIREVLVSPDGTRVYVSGESWGKDTSFDLVTIAYDASTGEQLWLQSYDGGSARELIGGANLSPDGSRLYVTGGSIRESTGEDYATIAYDTATGTQLWAARYDRVLVEGLQPGEPEDTQARTDQSRGLAVDPTGRFVAVTGRSALAGFDIATVLYDATDGSLIWSRRHQGTFPNGEDVGNAVTFSPGGTEVIAAGMATHPTTSPQRNTDLVTLWYSTDGGALNRIAQWDGVSTEDEAEAIVADPSGRHVYLTGRTLYSTNRGLSSTAQFVTLAYETTPDVEPTPTPSATESESSSPSPHPSQSVTESPSSEPSSTPDPSPSATSEPSADDPLIPRLDLPVDTHRVSVSSEGNQSNARSEYPTMSGDGRYVLFQSTASTLVPNDTNDAQDIFVHDRLTGETMRVSVNAAGEQAPAGADGASISRNGRYVVFYSGARNMVPDGRTGVFRKDLLTGEVELAAFGSFTIPAVHGISDNGRYVVYSSGRADIVPGVGPPQLPGDPSRTGNHIYVVDMETGVHKLVNVDIDGDPGTLHAQNPSISGDGHVAVFETRSPLDPRDTNGLMSVYAHNHVTNETEWISTNNYGEPPNDHAWRPRANYDGSVVAFDSTATNLVPRDQGGISPDVFLRDLEADRTEKVSVSSSGEPANGWAFRGSVSSNGRYVAYWSDSTNQSPGREEFIGDVYVHDRVLHTTERVSLPAGGGLGSNTSHVAALSGNATAVSFMSFAEDLVANDTNGVQDVFARQIGPSVGFVAPLKASVDNDKIVIDGITRAMGAPLSNASDPLGDLVADEETSEMVGDISGVEIAYRPEVSQELLFRASFDDLPFPVFGVAQPGTTYGVSFRVDGRRYEIRMNAAEDIALYPIFDLYSCEPICVPQKTTVGGFGTAGHEIDFTASLDDVEGGIGSTITDVRAFAGLGSSPTGAPLVLDEASAPDVEVPPVRAAVALESPGTAPRDARFQPVDAPQNGSFSAAVSRQSLPPGAYEAIGRICIVDVCGYGVARVTVDSEPPLPEPTVSPDTFSVDGTIDAFNPTSAFVGGVTENEFLVTCTAPPESQGVDGHVVALPERFATGTANATVVGSSQVDHDLDLAFYEADCAFISQSATAEPDESAAVPQSTGFIVINAAQGVDTSFALTVTGSSGTGSPSPTPSSSATDPAPPPPTGERGVYPPNPNDPYFATGGAGESAAEAFAEQWGPEKIRVPEAWQLPLATGHQVNVAVIDSGLDLGHPDFACPGKVGNGAVIIDGKVTRGASVQDIDGHGTHVAGIIGACTNNGTGTVGVAPDSMITPYRVFTTEDEETGSVEDIAVAIEQATDDGAHVINMSLSIGIGGLPGTGAVGYLPGLVPEIDDAIEYAQDKGVVVVAAAGNDAVLPLCEYPAIYEDVICVGATDPRDLRTWYSTFPNKPDNEDDFGPGLVAPGGTETVVFCDFYSENILSTYARDLDNNSCDGLQIGYETVNGTSMASPHVAGVAALVYDRLGAQRSAANGASVTDAIISSAVDLGLPGYDPVFGHGRLDALAAVQAVEPAPSPSPSVTASESPSPTESASPTASDSPSATPSPGTEPTDLRFTERSASTGQYTDETIFEARLTDTDGNPISGEEITLELVGSDSSRIFSATTDDTGTAAVTPTLTERPGPHQLTARFAGTENHEASAITTSFVVSKEDTSLQLTVDGKGKKRTLAARLVDADSETGVAGRAIDFYADGDPLGSAMTDDQGIAAIKAPPRYRGGSHEFEARFAGDDYYLRSADRRHT